MADREMFSVQEQTDFGSDVLRLAAEIHDGWRFGRTIAGGQFEPQPKPTSDEEWTRQNGRAYCDIANTGFADLPIDHQAENLAAATAVLKDVYRTAFYGAGNYGGRQFLHFDAVAHEGAKNVHTDWLERNGDRAPRSQKQQFDKLAEAEQKKDRDIYDLAADIVKEHLVDGTFETPSHLVSEWLMDDVQYLSTPLAAPRRGIFRRKGTSEPPVLTVEKLEQIDKDTVDVHLHIGAVATQLKGVYTLTDTARFVRDVRQNAPDPSEKMPLRQVELAQALHRSIQTYRERRKPQTAGH